MAVVVPDSNKSLGWKDDVSVVAELLRAVGSFSKDNQSCTLNSEQSQIIQTQIKPHVLKPAQQSSQFKKRISLPPRSSYFQS